MLMVKVLYHNSLNIIKHQISWLSSQRKQKILAPMNLWCAYLMVMRNQHAPHLKWQSTIQWKVRLQRLLEWNKIKKIVLLSIMQNLLLQKFKEMEFLFWRFSVRREPKNYQTLSIIKLLNLRFWTNKGLMEMWSLLWFHIHL